MSKPNSKANEGIDTRMNEILERVRDGEFVLVYENDLDFETNKSIKDGILLGLIIDLNNDGIIKDSALHLTLSGEGQNQLIDYRDQRKFTSPSTRPDDPQNPMGSPVWGESKASENEFDDMSYLELRDHILTMQNKNPSSPWYEDGYLMTRAKNLLSSKRYLETENEAKASEYSIKEEFDLQDQDGKYEMLSKADLSVTDATNYSTYSHDELPEEVKDSLKGDEDSFGESWSQKSSINRIESLERVGVKQGDAIKLSGLEFEDFGEDLQGELKGDLEDARREMKSDKDTLDKTDPLEPSYSFQWQQGGEVENPNSEFGQSYPDYNNIGESQTNMTSYECELCDSGFKSNEALSVHHNDKHAIAPESLDGYETEYAMGNYTDWFVQVDIPNTVQCDYCFDQFNADDQEGQISHINSTHDANVDPITGDTGKSWGESRASEKTGYRKRPTGHGTYVYEEKSKINCQNCDKEIYETDGDTFHTTKCRYCGHVNLTNDLTYESKASELYDYDDSMIDKPIWDNIEQYWDKKYNECELCSWKAPWANMEDKYAQDYPESWDQEIVIEDHLKREHRIVDKTSPHYHGESKASEIGMHGGDGASFYDGKTFTCDKCGKVGNSFSDMAQEECPADVNANHQIPIFGDMKKESYAHEDDMDTLMWDNENPDDKGKQWKDKKGKKEESIVSEGDRKRIKDWHGNTGTQKEDGSIVDDKDLIKLLDESKASETEDYWDYRDQGDPPDDWVNWYECKTCGKSRMDDGSDSMNTVDQHRRDNPTHRVEWTNATEESYSSESDVSFGTLSDYLGIDWKEGGSYCKICGKDLTYAKDNELLNHVNSHDDKTLLEGESKASEGYVVFDKNDVTIERHDEEWEAKVQADSIGGYVQKEETSGGDLGGIIYDARESKANEGDTTDRFEADIENDQVIQKLPTDKRSFDAEAGAEDHGCAECGFTTSDNSEYIDHLNSHEV